MGLRQNHRLHISILPRKKNLGQKKIVEKQTKMKAFVKWEGINEFFK